IMKLSGQEYVDIYATAAKRQLADEAKAKAEEAKRAQKQAQVAGDEDGRAQSQERGGDEDGTERSGA
ncbi:1-acyl-sn-glycerol-3-phosphate acyltransferase, partial [Streptomyces sp. SID8455]|nr:1-acyl-sn-glycerol-3-phosphate acyltransferase [Streptomyces sp. SID8455]